jgi:hypothetical protein
MCYDKLTREQYDVPYEHITINSLVGIVVCSYGILYFKEESYEIFSYYQRKSC